MIDLARIFATALARRVALVVVALVLGWCGLGDAKAQAAEPITRNSCLSFGSNCTPEQAWRACGLAAAYDSLSFPSSAPFACNYTGVPSDRHFRVEDKTGGLYEFRLSGTACPATSPFNEYTGNCETPCVDREDTHWLGFGMISGDRYCHDGCEWAQLDIAAGGGQASLGTCEAANPPCEPEYYDLITDTTISPGGSVCRATDTDGDGIPDITDPFPEDPGEDTDTDGDGIGDNTDHKPNDPDDGADTEGDEDGDDEGDNVSHGGGTCNAPPESSGDGILVQIAFQAWKTRCAIERVSDGNAMRIKGTGEGGGITVVGDTGGPGEGEQEIPGEGDYLGDGSGENPASDVMVENEYGGDGFDTSGFGWTRSCPTIPPVDVFGKSITFDTSVMCNWLTIGSYFVMLIAMLSSLRILMSA